MTTPQQQIPTTFLAQANQPVPIPAPAPMQLVDLSAEIQRQRDALPAPTTFALLGVQVTLPPIKAMPFDLQLRAGNNEIAMLQEVIGAEKVQELAAAGCQLGDLEILMTAWQQASGVKPGESPASTGS